MDRGDDSLAYDSQATVGLHPGDDAREYARTQTHTSARASVYP